MQNSRENGINSQALSPEQQQEIERGYEAVRRRNRRRLVGVTVILSLFAAIYFVINSAKQAPLTPQISQAAEEQAPSPQQTPPESGQDNQGLTAEEMAAEPEGEAAASFTTADAVAETSGLAASSVATESATESKVATVSDTEKPEQPLGQVQPTARQPESVVAQTAGAEISNVTDGKTQGQQALEKDRLAAEETARLALMEADKKRKEQRERINGQRKQGKAATQLAQEISAVSEKTVVENQSEAVKKSETVKKEVKKEIKKEIKQESRQEVKTAVAPVKQRPAALASGRSVQAGAFRNPDSARNIRKQLEAMGYVVHIDELQTAKGTLHRVRIEAFASHEEAVKAVARIKSHGIAAFVIEGR